METLKFAKTINQRSSKNSKIEQQTQGRKQQETVAQERAKYSVILITDAAGTSQAYVSWDESKTINFKLTINDDTSQNP